MAQHDDLNTSTIALVGFVGAVVVFAVILILTIIFYQVEARQRQEKLVSPAYAQVSKLEADQQGRLASYGWIDQKKQIALIPVARAMDLVVAELSRDPQADVTGVQTPADSEPPAEPDVPSDEQEEEGDASESSR
jgi:hypothetical protein